MSRVGRAVEKGETLGLLKLVVDADTDRILGAAFLGVGVTKQSTACSTPSTLGPH